MTPAEVKKSLGTYPVLREECMRIRKKIESKQRDLEYLKTVTSGNIAQHDDETLEQMKEAVGQINSLVAHYVEMIVEREKSEKQILAVLEQVEDSDAKSILYLRYIEGVQLKDIPEQLHMSDRKMWYKYKEAIEQLADAS